MHTRASARFEAHYRIGKLCRGNAELAHQAFFDKLNAEGGFFGRQIEPVYATYDLLLPVTQEEGCLKLVEDEEVFIVMYGTNDSFRQALDKLGMFELIELGQATYSGDSDWDGLDEFCHQTYDYGTGLILLGAGSIVFDRS